MSPTRAEGLTIALDDFLRFSADVEAAAVISADGLPMASALPQHIEEDRLGAMAAAMLSLGERAADNLGRGRLQQVFVEGSTGYVFLMAAGPAVLCAITRHGAKIGLVLYEMGRAAAAVARVFEGDGAMSGFQAQAGRSTASEARLSNPRTPSEFGGSSGVSTDRPSGPAAPQG